jgi:uncharacterized protein with PIN domain
MMVIESRAGILAADLQLGQNCCAYAASRIEGRPLLFKGSDFAKTDVEKALW